METDISIIEKSISKVKERLSAESISSIQFQIVEKGILPYCYKEKQTVIIPRSSVAFLALFLNKDYNKVFNLVLCHLYQQSRNKVIAQHFYEFTKKQFAKKQNKRSKKPNPKINVQIIECLQFFIMHELGHLDWDKKSDVFKDGFAELMANQYNMLDTFSTVMSKMMETNFRYYSFSLFSSLLLGKAHDCLPNKNNINESNESRLLGVDCRFLTMSEYIKQNKEETFADYSAVEELVSEFKGNKIKKLTNSIHLMDVINNCICSALCYHIVRYYIAFYDFGDNDMSEEDLKIEKKEVMSNFISGLLVYFTRFYFNLHTVVDLARLGSFGRLFVSVKQNYMRYVKCADKMTDNFDYFNDACVYFMDNRKPEKNNDNILRQLYVEINSLALNLCGLNYEEN